MFFRNLLFLETISQEVAFQIYNRNERLPTGLPEVDIVVV